jgi:TPR repeat protein
MDEPYIQRTKQPYIHKPNQYAMGIFSKKKVNAESLKILEEGMSYRGTDDKKAFEVLMQAAEMNNEVAEFYIARMYETGVGTEKDLKEAVSWYSDSVDDGCTVSAIYLARMFCKGFDSEYDADETEGLITDLLESGDLEAFRKAPDVIYEVADMLCNKKTAFDGTEIGERLMQRGADFGIDKCQKYFD